MKQSVTREDIEDILRAFEESGFMQLKLAVGAVQITVNRAPATTAHAINTPPSIAPVVAPLLGIFQAGPETGSPAFVQPGAMVQPDTTVGIIRVMQNLIPVKAGLSGTVLDVLVQDGQLVEFGQPLLRVHTESARQANRHPESR